MDKENQKFCLGIKQLEEDPWKRIEERMPTGSIIEGEVVRVTEFGAFVEVETGIEGLVHISELSDERVQKAEDVVKVGDKVKCLVMSIDKDAKKIALSMKNADGRENMKFANAQDEKGTSSLANQLKGFKA